MFLYGDPSGKGPCTRQLSTLGLSAGKCSAGFRYMYHCWVRGPLGGYLNLIYFGPESL